jgi:TonB family protein
VQTDVFATTAPAAKAAATLPARVQTGGFESTATAAIQSDRPRASVAAGFGDAGAAPAAGSRRVVATGGGGFGDAGVSSGGGSAGQRPIRAGGFGDAVPAAPSAGGARQTIGSTKPLTAAQILEKPRPAYTEEARRLQIEGEVQLEVQFRASGEVRIMRVIRGLGYGLDENAVQAARTIRFLPAKRDGQPVDSTATVHIIFQLAS